MSGSSKSIYRVRQLVGSDGAIVTEVFEEGDSSSGFPQPKEVRNSKVRLGGVDSFWLVSNVKSVRRFPSATQDTVPALPHSVSSTSLLSTLRGNSRLDFVSPFGDFTKNTKLGGVSFGTVTRLPVAIGPWGRTHEEFVRDLREGKLAVEIQNAVDAIEVRPNVFMISGFVRQSNGHFGLKPETRIRAVPTVSVVGKVEMTRLASGIIVFGARPNWTPESAMDLRSDDEILASSENWLSRLKAASSQSGDHTSKNPAELLKEFAAASVAVEEREDLESALRVLSERQALLDLLPQLMAKDEGLRARLQEFELTEEDRIRVEIKARLADEAEHEASRLAELRERILEAEGQLATVSHRETLLRNETQQHAARLQEKIDEAARAVGGASRDAIERLREEVAQLRADLERAKNPAPAEVATTAAPEKFAVAPTADLAQLTVATNDDRLRVLRELVSSTGLALSDLVAFILHSTEGVPVLVGDGSAGIAVDIATAIGGDTAAIVFCDPTQVSFADLLRDEAAGIGRAIEVAKSNTSILVPVALCGLTNGPCEYWLPQIVEMRRICRLPSNLALFASAGTDGLRVSVPKSLLRYLFPLAASRTEAVEKVEYVGHWAPFATDTTRIQSAIKTLRTKSVDPALMGRLADLLSRAPAGVDQNEIAGALVKEQEWISAWRDGADHDLMQHFQHLGN